MKTFFLLILFYGLALAQERQVVIRVERGPGADSLLAEARRIEPRLGEISVSNNERTTLGYKADSPGDTLKVPGLKAAAGKLVRVDIILLGAKGVRGGDLTIGHDERLKPLAWRWGGVLREFMTAAGPVKSGIMRLSFGAPGFPELPDSLLLCSVMLWRAGNLPGRNMWGASAVFTDRLAPKVIFQETLIGPEVRVDTVKAPK